MKFFFALFIFLLPLCTLAQQNDSQLAYTYYQNKEYDKAADMFFKLYERTRSSNFLDYYIICLINGKKYDQAEDVLKKFLKTNDTNKEFLINLGFIYEQQGKSNKAEEYYEKAIKKLIPHTSDINSIANKFQNIREYSWSVKTYLKGRELLKQPNAFLNELGDCYMLERDYGNMLALFVESIQINPNGISTIISKLGYARSNDIGNGIDDIIQSNLDNIFKTPDYSPAFDELAIWFALQKTDYTQAFEHAVRLNAKSENKLNSYLDIARSASNSKNFDIALQAYQRVLEKGEKDNSYYYVARKEILTCKYAACEQEKTIPAQYLQLAGECDTYMQAAGYSPANTDIVILMADIYAYRLHLPDSANIILQKGENIRQLNVETISKIKSKRADLLAFIDNPWEATILYTQIEKLNPNNDTGYEAKLKKARLAYYAGDLLWSKAQYDVLKGATSKLISNDAIKMSHFINTNYQDDEDNKELEKLAQTEYLLYKKQSKQAAPALDSIIGSSPPGIADYASLLKAKMFADDFKYPEAIVILEKLKNESEQTYVKAEAIFELAGLKIRMQEKKQAMTLYKTLVSEYPGSVYSVESGKLYRELEKNTEPSAPVIKENGKNKKK